MSNINKIKKKIFDVIQIGNKNDLPSKTFDIFITMIIFLNLAATIIETFNEAEPYMNIIKGVELVTCIIFAIEYVLRLWTAIYLYPNVSGFKAGLKFAKSFYGVIDLLTFFPYFLPFVIPSGAVAFRIFRVIRIFRLFQINKQYDAFNVIVNVLKEKKNQIFSSIVMILILMIASSLCMYNIEHEAQPEQFENAFSGIWWSVSTLLTVGYGDIYPITPLGKLMAIVITFLGVGMVAIPTGIISAGFVEQYTKLKLIGSHYEEKDIKFITSVINPEHPWNGEMVKKAVFPPQLILVIIIHADEVIVPRGDTLIQAGDRLIFAAKNLKEEFDIDLKEILIKEENKWVGNKIKDLDISRQELIVMIQRNGRTIIPNGSTVIRVNDVLMMYSKHKVHG